MGVGVDEGFIATLELVERSGCWLVVAGLRRRTRWRKCIKPPYALSRRLRKEMKTGISLLVGLLSPIVVAYITITCAWLIFCFQCGADTSSGMLIGIIISVVSLSLTYLIARRFHLRPEVSVICSVLILCLMQIYL